MADTGIEWVDKSDNWQAGCTNAGPECDNCYAEKMSQRLANMGQDRYVGVSNDWHWTGKITADLGALDRAFDRMERRRRPTSYFPGSMTDLWHRDAPADALALFAERLRRLDRLGTPHVLRTLTKRPQNLLPWQIAEFPDGLPRCMQAGVTAGNQRGWDIRTRVLREVRAHTRWVSVEPMLERIDTRATLATGTIGWIVVGCESLSGRPGRPTDEAWVREIRDAATDRGVRFFYKQAARGGEIVGTPELDGRQWVEFPA